MGIKVKSKAGHRERLKARFISGEEEALTDEALLELLLTYAILQKDVHPLAKKLIATFGSLSNVMSTDIPTLCEQEGIKEHPAVLLKVIDWIRKREYEDDGKQAQIKESILRQHFFQKILLQLLSQMHHEMYSLKQRKELSLIVEQDYLGSLCFMRQLICCCSYLIRGHWLILKIF